MNMYSNVLLSYTTTLHSNHSPIHRHEQYTVNTSKPH